VKWNEIIFRYSGAMDHPREKMDNSRICEHSSQMKKVTPFTLNPDARIADGFPGQRLVVVPREWIESTRKLPLIRDLQVTHIGHFNRASGHFVERKKGAPQYVLFYCLSGSGRCTLGGESFPIAAGDAVILPPGKAHAYGADPSDPWTIFWFHFSGGRAADFAGVLALPDKSPVFHSPQSDSLHQAFEETYRYALDGFSETAMLGLTTSLARLIGLLRISSRPRTNRVQQAQDRILLSIRRLQSEPMRAWSLDELAADAGMSLAHFSDLFSKQAGVAPKQFLIRQRLQIASALMQKPGLTVAEIAARVGYDDPYYFSRLFHKHTGQSPQAYRREITKAAQ
jgi:AraC-like DNA-binding protein/mannose-6-phosphate isomerase-like protein (cupin superfamily)